MNMEQFLAMGGYAAYVWPAYLITAFVMLLLVVVTLRDLRAQRRILAALESDGARKRAPARVLDNPK
jgi:heme exporter protein D